MALITFHTTFFEIIKISINCGTKTAKSYLCTIVSLSLYIITDVLAAYKPIG